MWYGNFFGFSVQGQGGKGKRRGCKVLRYEEDALVVNAINQGGS